MPTHLAIDDSLLDTALALSGLSTKRETVNAALREYIARRRRLSSLDAIGIIDMADAATAKRARSKR